MEMPVLRAAPSSIRNAPRFHPGDGALVTGADYRGLGIVRSLGRRGIPVWVLKQDEHLVGSVSRYACRSLRYPLEDDRKQLDFLLDLAVREGLKGWVLFPTTDESMVLLARYDEACALVDPEMLMVQEVVPGWGETQFSYAALCRDGCPVASIVARRTRQFPMDFGRFSTYVETVEEPQVIEPSVRLLAAIRFTGLVEVEFKRDPRNGQYKVFDVNPRVWGWHTLSKRAGVDFPYLLWLLVRGEPVPEARGRAGERWMRMFPDLPVAIQEILRGRLSLRAYVRSLQGPRESAIFAWDDPLPGFLELPLLACTLGKRILRGKGI